METSNAVQHGRREPRLHADEQEITGKEFIGIGMAEIRRSSTK
jgi:hypothetical protein